MNCSIFSILFVLTIGTFALPSAFVDEQSIEPINELDALLTPMTYIGPIDISGETHRINGTVEEIYEKILALNPEFNHLDWREPASSPTNGSLSVLEKRSKLPPNCDVGDYCNTKHIRRSIDILRVFPGLCEFGWGSSKCARLTCFDKSAIILCNDNLHYIQRTCRAVGGYAQEIVHHCQSGTHVRGQIFDTDHFNVIVRADICAGRFDGESGER